MDQRQTEAEAREELRDHAWRFAQRGVVSLVLFLAGTALGYQLWGRDAISLRDRVEQLAERTDQLVKERDTERGRITLIERDKKELERQIEELRAKVAAGQPG